MHQEQSIPHLLYSKQPPSPLFFIPQCKENVICMKQMNQSINETARRCSQQVAEEKKFLIRHVACFHVICSGVMWFCGGTLVCAPAALIAWYCCALPLSLLIPTVAFAMFRIEKIQQHYCITFGTCSIPLRSGNKNTARNVMDLHL